MPRRMILVALLIVPLFTSAVPSAIKAQTADLESQSITIIGTGRVASAIGPKWAAGGHQITYGSRTPNDERVQELVASTGEGTKAVATADAAEGADIVVLAIPYTAAEEVVASLGSLDGKIIIDPMNSAKFENGTVSGLTDSISADIAGWAPGARVVKALNTLGTPVMIDPSAVPEQVTVPIAGDDEAAKVIVAALVQQLGLGVFDAGSLHNAQYIDAMGLLYISANVFSGGGKRTEFRILNYTP